MAQVFPDTVKLYYEESKAARAQIESLLDKYRSNTSTLLTLATAAVAFFGFSTGPRFYWLAIGCYLLAVATSFLIFVPIPMRMNVAHDTAEELFVPPPITPAKMYYDLCARPPGRDRACTNRRGQQIRHRHSLPRSHRRNRASDRHGVAERHIGRAARPTANPHHHR
jgi:hypothetical protein